VARPPSLLENPTVTAAPSAANVSIKLQLQLTATGDAGAPLTPSQGALRLQKQPLGLFWIGLTPLPVVLRASVMGRALRPTGMKPAGCKKAGADICATPACGRAATPPCIIRWRALGACLAAWKHGQMSLSIDPSLKRKGAAAERRFQDWLDRSGLPYLYVEQTPVTVPEKLRGHIKRPDYIIGVPSVGNISCDVKAKTIYKDALIFDEYEYLNLANFERFFMSSVWLACYSNDEPECCYLFQNDWLLREPTSEIRGQTCVAMPLQDMLKVNTTQTSFQDGLMQAVDLS